MTLYVLTDLLRKEIIITDFNPNKKIFSTLYSYFSRVSVFFRVYERRKLRVNVGKSKVMRCSRYGNGDRLHVILNGERLEEVDLSTWDPKWQLMEHVKWMWYTQNE